jgi:hypothetical protein
MRTQFEILKFCAEEKLKKRTSDRLISMIKRRDFVIEDIHAETIREMEMLISECSRSKISGYGLWTKDDDKQEVEVYLRSMPVRYLVQGILADLGLKIFSIFGLNIDRRTANAYFDLLTERMAANYCAPDRIRSCPDRHSCFPRRTVGKNESLL